MHQVESGKADIAISGDFSNTWSSKGIWLLNVLLYSAKCDDRFQKSQADAYQNLAAFDGKKVAAQKGTDSENIVEDQSRANLVSLTKNGQMINELKRNGTVSGVVFEEPIAKAYVAANPDLAIVTNIGDSSKSDSYAIAIA